MKELLLTWYGITDLRAALGFETGDGPVVGAVRAHPYTGVVVLGYVRPEEQATDQEAFTRELRSTHEEMERGDRAAAGRFVARFANTPAAHRHVEAWLHTQLEGLSEGIEVTVTGQALNGLNDSEGIYAAAVRALEAVARDPEPSQVSLYLSPGTPTMAFTWAFAALAHPNIRKRLIAASDPTRPPEPVRLPSEWMERFGKPTRPGAANGRAFDAVFHLFGEQRLPTLLGVKQFDAARHIFVRSDQFSAAVMRRFTGAAEMQELQVDPYDPADVRDAILACASELGLGQNVGFNLTGGTKLMYAGALAAARALGATPFYFDGRNRRVVFLDGFDSEPVKPIEFVETFFNLNGDGLKISRKGGPPRPSPERALLTDALWRQRAALASKGFYRRVAEVNREFKPFKDSSGDLTFELTEDKTVKVTGGGLDLTFDDWPRFAVYLSGGWLEEYVYAQLKPYVETGAIKDLRINLELALNSPGGGFPPYDSYNELDVVFTDGYSLYIVECKAGNVQQEQVMKLENLVRYYGGTDGRGVLATGFPPSAKSVRRKIEDANITLCTGGTLVEQLKTLVDGIAARSVVVGQ